MKRRLRSYDYTEELTVDGTLHAMYLRIRDYKEHKTYYAEHVAQLVFPIGGYFYNDRQEPIDDNSVPQEDYMYTMRAFSWRMQQRKGGV